jgi:peptidoglycan/LPS O-acetylase OafA/YrhL
MGRLLHRPDIDGLRALAVLPVVLFHTGVPGFAGGFVGVDMFFVISGYLITGILVRGLEAGSFSLLQFYERRVRRILPALLAMLLLTSAGAWALLFPAELSNYGKSLFATALFYANYHYMADTGYFAAPADSKPLLHMWSLAVEEQYYLLFPLYLWVVWRWWRNQARRLTLALALLSLAYAIWLMGNAPDQAFYSAPARAWELMAGALLAMPGPQLPSRAPSGLHQWLAALGLLLLLGPVVGYTEATPFPGAAAVAPVLGTALLLHAAPAPGNHVGRLLALPLMRGIGLVSFSLYLWHWPVLVLYRAWALAPPGLAHTVWLLALMGALAVASWRWVEQPFRHGGRAEAGQARRAVATGLASLALATAGGAALALGDGLPGRFSPRTLALLATAQDAPSVQDCRPAPDAPAAGPMRACLLGAPGVPSLLVWGDSHAEALLPAVSAAATQAGVAGMAFVRGGCPPLLAVRQVADGFQDCHLGADAVLRYLGAHPEIRQVWLVGRWALYAEGTRFGREPGHSVFIVDGDGQAPSLQHNASVFRRQLAATLAALAPLQRQVLVVGQAPEVEFRVPTAAARLMHLGRMQTLAPSRSAVQQRQAALDQALAPLPPMQPPLQRLDLQQALCDAQRCAVTDDTGLPLYRDSNHLTRHRALSLAPVFRPFLLPAQR